MQLSFLPMKFTILFLLSVVLCLNVAIGQDDSSLKKQLHLFPNPVTTGSIYIEFKDWNDSFEEVEIFDVTGVKVFDAMVNIGLKSEHRLDLSALSYGHYFVLVKSSNQVYSKRITIQ